MTERWLLERFTKNNWAKLARLNGKQSKERTTDTSWTAQTKTKTKTEREKV